jgi:hypothetical protein
MARPRSVNGRFRQEFGGEFGERFGLDKVAFKGASAGPRHGVFKDPNPSVLDQHGGQRGARLQRLAEIPEHLGHTAHVAECPFGRPSSCGRIQPEIQQLRDEAARPAMQVDGEELACLRVCRDEEHIEDAQRFSALHPLQGADQLAFEGGARPESVDQELSNRLGGHAASLTG